MKSLNIIGQVSAKPPPNCIPHEGICPGVVTFSLLSNYFLGYSPAPAPRRILPAAAQNSSPLHSLACFSRPMIFSLSDRVEKLPAIADSWPVGIAICVCSCRSTGFRILLTPRRVPLDSCLMLQCCVQFWSLIG